MNSIKSIANTKKNVGNGFFILFRVIQVGRNSLHINLWTEGAIRSKGYVFLLEWGSVNSVFEFEAAELIKCKRQNSFILDM